MKDRIKTAIFITLDWLMAPATLAAAWWLKKVRIRFHDAHVSRRILGAVGLLPVRDHYFEPYVDEQGWIAKRGRPRLLPGIDLNHEGQVAELEAMDYAGELARLPMAPPPQSVGFYYDNSSFGYGDSEYLYCIVRRYKPARIIEVGSGMSTLMALEAVAANRRDDPAVHLPGHVYRAV